MEQHKQCPRCGEWTYGYSTTEGYKPGPHYCNPKKDDPIAAARQWLDSCPYVLTATQNDYLKAVVHVRALLAKIEQLKENNYAALKQDTDRQIIADSEQYTRGYDKAIEDAIEQINAANDAIDAVLKVAALSKGGEDD